MLFLTSPNRKSAVKKLVKIRWLNTYNFEKEVKTIVKTVCNICGKDFDKLDEAENFGLHYKVGYGSVHDGDEIDLDLCCSCFDEFIDYIISRCKINPIKNNDYVGGK